jgi:hypothetical protein
MKASAQRTFDVGGFHDVAGKMPGLGVGVGVGGGLLAPILFGGELLDYAVG